MIRPSWSPLSLAAWTYSESSTSIIPARTSRAAHATDAASSVSTGRTSSAGWSIAGLPGGMNEFGCSQWSSVKKTSRSSVPATNSGSEISASRPVEIVWSVSRPALSAEIVPKRSESGTSRIAAVIASVSEFSSRSWISGQMGAGMPLLAVPTAESPRSPCTAPESQFQYRTGRGWSNPSFSLSARVSSGVANLPSAFEAGLPGSRSVAAKISIEATSSVRTPVAALRRKKRASGARRRWATVVSSSSGAAASPARVMRER